MNETHQFLGASVDGIMVLKGLFYPDQEPIHRTVLLEIKSKVSEVTAIDAEEYKTKQRIKSFNYVRVQLSNRHTSFPEFRKHIPDSDLRTDFAALSMSWLEVLSIYCGKV